MDWRNAPPRSLIIYGSPFGLQWYLCVCVSISIIRVCTRGPEKGLFQAPCSEFSPTCSAAGQPRCSVDSYRHMGPLERSVGPFLIF